MLNRNNGGKRIYTTSMIIAHSTHYTQRLDLPAAKVRTFNTSPARHVTYGVPKNVYESGLKWLRFVALGTLHRVESRIAGEQYRWPCYFQTELWLPLLLVKPDDFTKNTGKS